MKIKIKSIKQVARWEPEITLAPWQDFITSPAQKVAGSFKAVWGKLQGGFWEGSLFCNRVYCVFKLNRQVGYV